jgi:hypothetical protein
MIRLDIIIVDNLAHQSAEAAVVAADGTKGFQCRSGFCVFFSRWEIWLLGNQVFPSSILAM